MSQYGSLSKEEQARVDRKLTELQKNTGESWSCEVTQLPQGENQNPLLEIAIDGRITKPILLGMKISIQPIESAANSKHSPDKGGPSPAYDRAFYDYLASDARLGFAEIVDKMQYN